MLFNGLLAWNSHWITQPVSAQFQVLHMPLAFEFMTKSSSSWSSFKLKILEKHTDISPCSRGTWKHLSTDKLCTDKSQYNQVNIRKTHLRGGDLSNKAHLLRGQMRALVWSPRCFLRCIRRSRRHLMSHSQWSRSSCRPHLHWHLERIDLICAHG